MNNAPRYRRSDKHPANAELFFWRYNRGKEIWITQSELTRRVRIAVSRDKLWKQTPNGKKCSRVCAKRANIKHREYRLSYYKRPEVRERIRKKYHSDPAVKEKIRAYYKKKQKNNVWYRFARNLRTRISRAIKSNIGATKASTLRQLIGCSIQALRIHLESQFTIEMSWENYGTYWHVDHKLPLSLFDLTKPEQQKIAFNFENLQPLRALENMRKSDKIGETSGREFRKVIPFKAA
jgi:hypothetical protein